jgi:O-antigen/teichoic acid export membrane protein
MNHAISAVIFRNTIWNYLSTLVGLAVGLALVPLMIRFLGEAHYGLWVLLGAVAGYASLLDVGFSVSICKWLAEHRNREADQQRNAFLSTMLVALLALGVFVLLATAALALVVNRVFAIDPPDIATARLLLLVVGLAAAAEFPLGLFGHVVFAHERLDIANGLTIAHLLLGLLGTVVVLVAGYGVLAVGAVTTGVTLVIHAFRLVAAHRIVPSLRLSFQLFDARYLHEIRRFSLYMSLNQLSRRLTLKTDEIIVGAFLPLSAVSMYSIGLRLSNAARTLSEQLARVVFPAGASLYAQSDMARVRRLVVEGSRVTLALGLPFAITVFVLADEIIGCWVGRPVESAAGVSRLLVAATAAAMVQWVPITVALAVDRAVVPSILATVEATVNVGLSLLLVSQFGLLGVAVGTLLPAIVIGTCMQVPYACRALHIPMATFVREAVLLPSLPAIPVAGALVLWTAYAEDGSPISLLLRIAFVPVAYWLLFLRYGLPAADARRYRNQVRLFLAHPLSGVAR